jgi:polyphosphate kinase
MTPPHAHDPALFINRELSWLAFNERVLEEATDPSTPLLERVKFAAITASNLDEFFMVRVAGLIQAIEEGDTTPDLAGLTPVDQLALVGARAHALVASLYQLFVDVLAPALAAHDIRIVRVGDLPAPQQAVLAVHFRDAVFPVLTPLAIDVSRPFPLLSSLSVNVAVLLAAAAGETKPRLAIVQVPPAFARLVPVASPGAGFTFVLLEDLIREHLPLLFPGQSIVGASVIRLVRDSELELDDEGGRTHLELVEREVRRRRRSDVVRLEVEAAASAELLALLRDQLDVTPADIYAVPGPLDLRVLTGLADLPGFPELRDPPLQPADAVLDTPHADLFTVLDEHDVLLHHPYDAYDPVVALIAQAASDPDVLAIKMTLYRTSVGSPIIASLRTAAERNKQVTVLVELTARFDEERNIQWARSLEEAGAHVIYGIRGYKTHAKICLIVRRTPHGLRRYVHLGTGNYNERTARLYTDFGLMTASPTIAGDATAFFSALTGYSDPPRLKKLVMAPTAFRPRLLKLIARERRRAEAGQPAEILAKMNSLIDDEIVHALHDASRAGVRIRLNVRGICALRPGMPGVSERIEVVSIVDRFLEHSRIYYFQNGGDEEVYLASGDWMTRNLDRRVELMFPVDDAVLKARVMQVLRAMFLDTEKARWLRPDGVYERRPPADGQEAFRVQTHLQEEARRRASVARGRTGIVLQPEGR